MRTTRCGTMMNHAGCLQSLIVLHRLPELHEMRGLFLQTAGEAKVDDENDEGAECHDEERNQVGVFAALLSHDAKR